MTSDPHHGAGGSPIVGGSPPNDEISLWEVLAVLLRRRGTIVLTTVLTAAAAVAFTLLRAETYTTEASFRPQGSDASASQLMALASQFGVRVPGVLRDEELTPAFYADLLVSREILHRVASRDFEVAGEGRASLADLFEIERETEELRLEEAIEELRDRVLTISTGRETGIVTVEVQTKWPDLSQEIAERLLDEIARFTLHTRQSQASAERVFIQERVDSAHDALLAAESDMQSFLQANRQWENSPDLTFQHDRLQRDISLRQGVYTTLVQSFEQARISEVRDTPVITVLQAPFVPPGPDERRLLLVIALGVVLGGMAGVVLAFVVEAVKRPAPGDPAREDFQQTWEGLVRSLPFVRRSPA
ncbi:MAG TPA: Wzz/FepE/Etk N-terminal domain-containing protein [Longimicrobiales bacterium]|nr:Wzz/FepE/Etk N-terminal domain-containing protein [Longimicrobiales bacterium]